MGTGMEQELKLGPVFSYEYYQSPESRSREWADAQALDPNWMERDEYGGGVSKGWVLSRSLL